MITGRCLAVSWPVNKMDVMMLPIHAAVTHHYSSFSLLRTLLPVNRFYLTCDWLFLDATIHYFLSITVTSRVINAFRCYRKLLPVDDTSQSSSTSQLNGTTVSLLGWHLFIPILCLCFGLCPFSLMTTCCVVPLGEIS